MKHIFIHYCTTIYHRLINKINQLFISQFVNIKDCEIVCLTLGPTRNLTSLTAAVLSLHPNCQALNHCGNLIFGNRRMDFLTKDAEKNYTKRRLNNFIKFSIVHSASNQRFGPIVHSHAWEALPTTIRKTYSDEKKKKQIKCLFWKEPHHTYNHIQNRHIDLIKLLEQEDRLRCLMPIRNCMDCAISTTKMDGYLKLHGINPCRPDGTEFSKKELTYMAIKSILDQIHQFAEYKEKFPSRFFYYFEHSISREMLIELATFLKLPLDELWLSNALHSMEIHPPYEHTDEYVDFYSKTVHEKFSDMPNLAGELLKFK